MYIYGGFMLKFDKKQQNSVKQLSFNKNINLKMYIEKTMYTQFVSYTIMDLRGINIVTNLTKFCCQIWEDSYMLRI